MNRFGVKRRRPGALVSALAAAVVLSGCASGEDGGGSSLGGEDLEGDPVVIGAIVNSTETNPSEKPLEDILEAWGRSVNEDGGIGGRPVEFVFRDVEGDAAKAVTAAQELIANGEVVAVLTGSTITDTAIGPLFAESDLAVGGVGFDPTVWSAVPNFYSSMTTFPALITMAVSSAEEVQAQRIGTILCGEFPSCLGVGDVLDAGIAESSIENGGVQQVLASAPNYTAECLQAIQGGVDFLALSVSGPVSGRVMNDCDRQGYDGYYYMAGGAVLSSVLDQVPDGAKVAVALNGFPWWQDNEPAQAFRDAMDENGIPEDEYLGPIQSGMWSAAELLRAAIEAGAGEGDAVTREAVQNGYGALQDEDLDGMLPVPVNYTPGEPAPDVPCFWTATYTAGEGFSGAEQPECRQ